MQKNLAIIGYAGSGKSHFAALLYLHLVRVAEERRINLILDVDSSEFDIAGCANSLRNGVPLLPTPPGKIFEAMLDIKFPGLFRERSLSIPVIDVAGEALQTAMKIMDAGSSGRADYQGRLEAAQTKYEVESDEETTVRQKIHETIFQADAICFVFNLVRELRDGTGDIEYRRFYQNLRSYRERHDLPPVTYAGFVFTKEDEVRHELDALFGGMPTADQLSYHFAPTLRVEVGSSVSEPLEHFMSYTEWRVPPNDSKGTEGEFQLVVDTATSERLPIYPEETYNRLVDWLSDF